MVVDFENGEIVARDGENEWCGAELYYFLLDEVLSFDIYGNLMEGYSIDESIINSVKEYAKKYDIEPQAVKNSTNIRRRLELKEANPDTIILYKQHKVFEVIGEDARTVAFELQTRLGETTYPDKTQQFVLETYVEAERLEYASNKLIENGHQVIIADDETALPAQEYFAQINEPPIWKSYKQLDEQYPDTLLFMRLGDFYEVMGENAKVAAKDLDLVLTGRTINTDTGERTPMCGVPVHNIDLYISQLVAKGYKVAIAENRDVNRVVTPGKSQIEDSLERAKQLINEYRHREFGYDDSADFSDLSNVNLATTETEDGKHSIEVSIDLENYNLNTFVDGKLFKQHISHKEQTCSALSDFLTIPLRVTPEQM